MKRSDMNHELERRGGEVFLTTMRLDNGGRFL